MGLLMPPLKAPDADYEANWTWRIVFGLSFVFLAFAIVGLCVFLRWETPKFLLS